MSQVGRHEASPRERAELQRLIVRGGEGKLLVQGQVHATHRRKVELPGRFGSETSDMGMGQYL